MSTTPWGSAICLVLVAMSVQAEEVPDHPLLNDHFRVSLGGFAPRSTTAARLGTSGGGLGVDLIFEDTLGLESRKNIAELSGYWRFAKRWRVDVDYFRLSRSASRTLSADISWGDQTFTTGMTVDSSVVISDTRAALGYSFFQRPDKELGLGAGLHTLRLKASIEVAGGGGDSEAVAAPLPVFSLFGNFALTDRWAFSVRSDWLSLDYQKYSGEIRSSAVDFVYQPYKRVAFGFGLHGLSLKLDVADEHKKFQTRASIAGPAAFVSLSF